MAAIAARTLAERRAEWEALNEGVTKMEADGVRRCHRTTPNVKCSLAIVRHRHREETCAAAWPGGPLLAHDQPDGGISSGHHRS